MVPTSPPVDPTTPAPLTPLAAALRAAETADHAPGAAVIIATQDSGAGGRVIYSRGDAGPVLDLARAILDHAAPDAPGEAPPPADPDADAEARFLAAAAACLPALRTLEAALADWLGDTAERLHAAGLRLSLRGLVECHADPDSAEARAAEIDEDLG